MFILAIKLAILLLTCCASCCLYVALTPRNRKFVLTSSLSNQKHVTKTGRHTYASWSNAEKYDDDRCFDDDSSIQVNVNTNDSALAARSITRTEKYSRSNDSWLKSFYTQIIFYGLNNVVRTKKFGSRLKPSSYKASPFFTISESIGMKIIEDEIIKTDVPTGTTSERIEALIQQNLDLNPDETSTANIKTREYYEEQLVTMSEDLQIIDVSIADIKSKLDRVDSVLSQAQKDILAMKLGNLNLKRENLLEDIENIQIAFVNTMAG